MRHRNLSNLKLFKDIWKDTTTMTALNHWTHTPDERDLQNCVEPARHLSRYDYGLPLIQIMESVQSSQSIFKSESFHERLSVLTF